MSITNGPPPDPPTWTDATLGALLERQRQAFGRAGPPSLAERRADLAKLRRAVKRNAGRIAEAISADFGNRARAETLLAEVWPTLSGLRHTMRHLGRWMRPRRAPVGLELLPGKARILYQPLGVVGIISPWNYPFQLAAKPLAAALAAGNRVMLKPSERTPRTAQLLAELLGEVFPAEQVAVVTGDAAVGAAFSRLPFDHLFYTGSTAIGREVMRAAAENLTPVTLELGGKSPCLLGEDAAMERAVESIVFGKLLNAGQTCIAPDYVLVPEARRDEFVELAQRATRKFYPTLARNPDYTSIISEHHYRRLARCLDEATARGARVIEINPAAEALPPGERRMAPTLVVDPADDLEIMREEIFGPVLPVKSYRHLDEAIAYINERPRPLALYYFGSDGAARDAVLQRTISGGASVNDTLLHQVVDDLPFGGIGASGMGAYHGEFGFQAFSHRKGVFLQSRLGIAWLLRPPFGLVTKLMLRVLMSR